MDYIGGIEGMKFTPIANYNSYLKNSNALDVDSDNNFESILNKQIASGQDSHKIQGGIEMNANFDDFFAQNSIQAADANGPTGNFLTSFSDGLKGGLNSVNQSVEAANKAQEAFAMGEDVSVHDVMIAAEKATLNMDMAMQLRNKMVTAYNELKDVRV